MAQMKTYIQKLEPEEIDPQLRNNQELSRVLREFEDAWTLASEHIVDPYDREDLI